MLIFTKLKNNKGTISSALGKKLAQEVLDGKTNILSEAIKLTSFELKNTEAKNIRAGAAKIVEIVAEKNPKLVAKHLAKLFPALDAEEPQTKWMTIRTFGFCSRLNPKIALKAMSHAKEYINANQGLCLSSSAELYLGDIGTLSPSKAKTVLPILIDALKKASTNEVDWILESFIKIMNNLDQKSKTKVINLAKKYKKAPKKSTQKRVERILKTKD